MKLYLAPLIIIFVTSQHSIAKPQSLQRFVGHWDFSKCTGEITQYRERLSISLIDGGVKITQTPLEGPQSKNRSFTFLKEKYSKISFERSSEKPLQRQMITKIIDGTLVASSTWSPIHGNVARDFLSTVIAVYDVTKKGKLRIKYTGNSFSNGSVDQSSASCVYNKAVK